MIGFYGIEWGGARPVARPPDSEATRVVPKEDPMNRILVCMGDGY